MKRDLAWMEQVLQIQPQLLRQQEQYREALCRMRVATGAIWALLPRRQRRNNAGSSVGVPMRCLSKVKIPTMKHLPAGLSAMSAAAANDLSYAPMRMLEGSLLALFSRSVRHTLPLKVLLDCYLIAT